MRDIFLSPYYGWVMEVKGFDPLREVKKQAAERRVAAVNAESSFGTWIYEVVQHPADAARVLSEWSRNAG